MTLTVVERFLQLDAPTPTPTPKPKPSTGVVPSIRPDLNSTGMAGFVKFINTLAGWTLLASLAAAILGLLVFALGPALGIQSGRRYGTMIMLSSLGVAALLAIIAGLINLVYAWFS